METQFENAEMQVANLSGQNEKSIEDIYKRKVCEITVNTRKLTRKSKSNRKASDGVKKLKKFIQKQWKSNDPVYIDEKLNKKIWERGNCANVGRIRISVEPGFCKEDIKKKCFHVSLIETSNFKNLKDTKSYKDL